MKIAKNKESLNTAASAKDNRLGELIRKRRTAKNMTQEMLASVFCLTKNTVGAWEQGRNTPKVDDIPALCDVLGMSIYEFFGLSTPFEETPRGRELLTKISELNDYNMKLISRMADAMIDAQEEERRKDISAKICRIFHNEEKTAAGSGNPLSDHRRGNYMYLYGNDMIWDADEVITVTGDSMEPTYSDGDRLLVQYTEQIKPGQGMSALF